MVNMARLSRALVFEEFNNSMNLCTFMQLMIFLDSTFHALDYYISMFMIGLAHRFMHAR